MKTPLRNFALMALMLLTAALGSGMRPTRMLADELPPIDLETMVPKQFGDWTLLQLYTASVINPQQQETLERIYSQTLSRTYVNPQGYRIMLSVAYGRDQSKSLELHSPEVCYPAQGFSVQSKARTELTLAGRPVPGIHLETHLGPRHEPITYWNVIGNHVTTTMLDKRLVDLGYNLRGLISDGVLMRISSLDDSNEQAYAKQAQFATALANAIAPDTRARFIGAVATP